MFKDDDKHETCYCENCLELQQKLQAKEQECEELKQWKKDAENLFKTQTDNADKIINRNKQALEEIRKIIDKMSTKTILTFLDFTREENLRGVMKQCCSGYIEILNIINKTKEYKTMNTNEPNQKEMQFIYGERKGCTAIYAIDKPSPNNNSYHEFIINYEPDSETSELLGRIKLQNGNFKEFGHNGIFTEHLLVIARDCLERFNTSKYACRENSIAINNINTALMWLNKRATERVKRGVYGTETV